MTCVNQVFKGRLLSLDKFGGSIKLLENIHSQLQADSKLTVKMYFSHPHMLKITTNNHDWTFLLFPSGKFRLMGRNCHRFYDDINDTLLHTATLLKSLTTLNLQTETF